MPSAFLDAFAPEDRRRLLSQARRRRFRRGEVVFHEGDPGDTLHLIDRGHVAVRRTTPMGDVGMLLVLGPGDVFGELAVVAPAARNATVSAIDAVETLAIGQSVLVAWRERSRDIDRMLISMLADEVRRLSAALMDALYLPVKDRMGGRLRELASAFPENEDGSVVIPLTQEELAQMVGTTRPTVNRLLKSAEQRGLLAIERGGVRMFAVADGDGRRR